LEQPCHAAAAAAAAAVAAAGYIQRERGSVSQEATPRASSVAEPSASSADGRKVFFDTSTPDTAKAAAAAVSSRCCCLILRLGRVPPFSPASRRLRRCLRWCPAGREAKACVASRLMPLITADVTLPLDQLPDDPVIAVGRRPSGRSGVDSRPRIAVWPACGVYFCASVECIYTPRAFLNDFNIVVAVLRSREF